MVYIILIVKNYIVSLKLSMLYFYLLNLENLKWDPPKWCLNRRLPDVT